MELVHAIEQQLLEAPDGVCLERARLVTEAYRRHEDQPMPILRAMALRRVLEHMTLDLQTNPVFAGNTSTGPNAMMLVPEGRIGLDSQIALEHPDLADILTDAVPKDILEFWKGRSVQHRIAGVGHFCADLDMVVNRGLASVIEQIDACPSGLAAQNIYRQAMKLACQAVIDWAARYADAAEAKLRQEQDATVRTCLQRMASACRHVPARPARNLFEGLQAILLVHLAMYLEGQGLSVSIGLPDRALRRFADEAQADPSKTRALIGAFLLGVAANSTFGRGSKSQAITIGGADHLGRDRCNAVTLEFLRALDVCRSVSDPHVFVRWHGGLPEQVMAEAARLLAAGRSMPLLVNDHVIAGGLEDLGLARRDAWDYAIHGCNELGVPGRYWQTGCAIGMSFNDLEILDAVLRAGKGPLDSMGDVLRAYGAEVFARTDKRLTVRLQQMDELADKLPMPFCSACFQGTVRAGDDLMRALPDRKAPCVFVRGTSNAANVLNVLDRCVFAGTTTLEELVARVDARDPATLERIAQCPTWGRDDDQADRWAVELCEARTRALRRVAEGRGLAGIPVCHVVRSLHHLDGLRIGATLDGRPAREPVADSIGPVVGTNPDGPTAALNSVLKIDARKHFQGIYNLNLTLPGATAPQAIAALVEAFFRDGGQELQINVLDPARLRAALADPQRHRDLVVRVAGLNARFVELSPKEQQELLLRAELACR